MFPASVRECAEEHKNKSPTGEGEADMKLKLGLSVSVLALMCCEAAHAQTTPSNSASAINGSGIEEVVVTAERRSENLMKTPITASVLSATDLQNRDVMNVNDLQFIAPNVTVNDLGQGVDFDIRGIGKGEHNTQTPVGVVTYRDGVSTFPGYLTGEPYYDIKSVEVYRGPQGTFVGQNATGGAVFVTTNDPDIGGGYSGYVTAQYGNYNDAQLQGAVNIPLTDDLAIRVAAFGERQDSFYNITDSDPADACPHDRYVGCKPGYTNPGLREGAGRLSLLWEPTSNFTLSFKYDALYQNYGVAPAVPYSNLLPVGAPVAPYGFLNPYHNKNLFDISANAPMGRDDREQRAILKMDYTFADGIKLQSISDYNVGNGNWKTDLDLTSLPAGNPGDFPYFGTTNNWTFYDSVDEKIYSEEINLVSPDNQPITWVAGLYGQENDYIWNSPYQYYIAVGPRFPGGPTPNASNFYQYASYTFQGKTTNVDLAGFGQVAAKLGDGWEISLGGRWTETRSHNNADFWNYGNGFGVTTLSPTPILDIQTQKSQALTYKAAIDWAVNDNDYLYAFVATGYTGGGLNTFTSSAGGPAPFGKVTDTDYEAGWKRNSWFDGHLRTELDAFYTNYDHFQITLSDPSVPLNTYEINLPKTTSIYGAEGEAQAVFGQLSFTATGGLLKSSLGNYWAVDPRYNEIAFGTCLPSTGGTDPYCVNVKGHPVTYAPSVTYNFSAQYIFDVGGNGDTFTPRVNFAHVSSQWASIFDNSSLGDHLGVRNLLGAQLEYQTNGWFVTLYADNATDQQYVASNNSGGLYAGTPRQYGIRLSKSF
jgi:iron complex outermembrane recepter protein